MSTDYIAITIGPIFDMMNLVSSPASLWASSFIFSSVTREICRKLVKKGVDAEDIISPYYDEEAYPMTDGVGLYHDRILFKKPEGFDVNSISGDIKSDVIEKITKTFFSTEKDAGKIKSYLDQYIMVAAVDFPVEDGQNPLIESSKMLDCLELAKPFVSDEKKNYILDVFTGEDENVGDDKQKKVAKSKNDNIKNIVNGLKIKNWQLLGGEGNIKDLSSIAEVDSSSNKKYNDYCVVVRADGDNIGRIISRQIGNGIPDKDGKTLTTDEKIRNFSKTCFEYCSEASKLVKDFGGVTIYSGGDDLLAIMHCVGKIIKNDENNKEVIAEEKGTVIDFAAELSDAFDRCFKDYIDEIEKDNQGKTGETDPVPSLSVAELIFYKKFPLYEAVEQSIDLLFRTAKESKNCMALSLQKHAGQSEKLIIPAAAYDDIRALQRIVLTGEVPKPGVEKADIDKINSDDVLLSALHKIAMFASLFDAAKSEDQIQHIFENTFDAASHADNEFVHKILPEYYNKFKSKELHIHGEHNKEGFADDFSALLRVMKFFTEKGGSKRNAERGKTDGNI